MKQKFLKVLLCSGVAITALFSSCIKNDINELGDKGQTFVKISEAPEKKFFFSPFTDVKKLDLFSLRRDVTSATINSAQVVKLVSSPQIVTDYNTEHKTTYAALPEGTFTIANSAFQKVAGGYNVSFGSGDFAKEFTIMLDGSKWLDLGQKYALGFKVTDAGGSPISDGQGEVVVLLSIKNKYDGKYEAEAISPMVDAAVSTITGDYPFIYELHTLGANSVAMYHPGRGDYFHSILSGGAASVYGSFAPVFTMDDAGQVISVTNYYGQPAGNGRSAKLDPSGTNMFTVNADGSKTLEVKYLMLQPGTTVRTTYHEKFTYKGQR